jgi:hypothetical protein
MVLVSTIVLIHTILEEKRKFYIELLIDVGVGFRLWTVTSILFGFLSETHVLFYAFYKTKHKPIKLAIM